MCFKEGKINLPVFPGLLFVQIAERFSISHYNSFIPDSCLPMAKTSSFCKKILILLLFTKIF